LTPGKPGTLLLYPAPSTGGFMIALIQRLNRAETQADKEEFVRGLANLKDTKKPLLVGLVAGYLLTNRILKK
jgi:hypothetical protein